jgi:hypothetical protein
MPWTIGVLGFDSRRELVIFLFTTTSRTTLRPTQLSIQWVPGALSLRVKRSGLEADHSPPSSDEVKECVELYLHSPIRLHGVVLSLKKHRDNFTFTFYLYLTNNFAQAPVTLFLLGPDILHSALNLSSSRSVRDVDY